MKKIIFLLVCAFLITGCDDTCTKQMAAHFLVAYRGKKYNDFNLYNWSINSIIRYLVVGVENTGIVDERYETPICRAEFRDYIDVEMGIKEKRVAEDSPYACFTYIPRTKTFVQVTNLENCCNPNYVDGIFHKFCDF